MIDILDMMAEEKVFFHLFVSVGFLINEIINKKSGRNNIIMIVFHCPKW